MLFPTLGSYDLEQWLPRNRQSIMLSGWRMNSLKMGGCVGGWMEEGREDGWLGRQVGRQGVWYITICQ